MLTSCQRLFIVTATLIWASVFLTVLNSVIHVAIYELPILDVNSKLQHQVHHHMCVCVCVCVNELTVSQLLNYLRNLAFTEFIDAELFSYYLTLYMRDNNVTVWLEYV